MSTWTCDQYCCSATKLCPTLCDPVDCSTSGFPVLHYLPEFAQTHVHWVSDAIQPSHPHSISSFSSCAQSFPASGAFPMCQLFIFSGQESIRASALASVLPMNIQGWFPLGLTNLISLLSKGSQESYPASQFKSSNSSVLSLLFGPPHIRRWLKHSR